MNTKFYLAALLCAATCVTAAEGVRYKDRLFEVGEAKTVTVADSVPFVSTDSYNYSTLSAMMALAKSDPMMYFYKAELVEFKPLQMDIYEPLNDSAIKRPAVIVSHGGAFVAGEKTSFDQKAVAYVDSLAARGFVTASLEYRKGVVMKDFYLSEGMNMVIDSVAFARTVFKASQDVHAAVRYMRANAEALNIDTNKIYLLGNSAGGLLGFENIYAQTMDDYPKYIEDGTLVSSEEDSTVGYVQVIEIEERDEENHPTRYYETVPLGNLETYGAQGVGGVANGVVSLWGAIHNPELVKKSRVPVFLAHGENDDVIPYKVGYAMSDANGMLNDHVPEAYKPIIEAMNIDLKVNTPTLYGSYVIDSILTENGVYHEFYSPLNYDLKHEFYNVTREEGTIVFADSVQNKVFDFLYRLAIDSLEAEELPTPLPFATIARATHIEMGENNLNFTVVRGDNVAYAVFDMRGRRMLSGRASVGETVRLDVLNNGVYYLRVQGEVARRIAVRK